MRFPLLAAAFLLVASPAHAAPATPQAFGEAFCAASLAGDMSPIESQLSPTLSVIVADAWTKNDALQAAHPDDKPPLGDGLPWRSWQDYADDCTIGDVEGTAESAKVQIRYGFAGNASAGYADRLILVHRPDGWVLDDIEFDTGDTMRKALADAFADQPTN